MASTRQIVLLFSVCSFLVLLLSTPVSSISCVQCTPADARCDSGNIEPTECDDSHSYCAMYRVFVGDSQGVFRGCTQHSLRGCRRRTIEKQESMVCYHTCSWSGCNAGYGSMMTYLLWSGPRHGYVTHVDVTSQIFSVYTEVNWCQKLGKSVSQVISSRDILDSYLTNNATQFSLSWETVWERALWWHVQLVIFHIDLWTWQNVCKYTFNI